jgi:hypothetical protein
MEFLLRTRDPSSEPSAMTTVLRKPLTRRRIVLAMFIAITADALQLIASAPGWAGFDQAVDVLTMSLLTFLIGFHPLFLPTFVIEFFPVMDMLPTWTGCTAAVVALRRKQQRTGPAPPPQPSPPGAIDI